MEQTKYVMKNLNTHIDKSKTMKRKSRYRSKTDEFTNDVFEDKNCQLLRPNLY